MNNRENQFLNLVFNHILDIAKGECRITNEVIDSTHTGIQQEIMEGLLYLHEDLKLSEKDELEKMESLYKLKILEEKNKQLEQFNYAASHDLKEPLRTINSFSKLILRTNESNLDENGKQYLQFIIESSQRMWNLLTGLLSYTTLENQGEISEIDVSELVNNILNDLSAQIEEKSAIIEIHKLPIINAFSLELHQLIQNLLSNSLKFGDPKRDLHITISYSSKNSMHQFSIKDTGIGIEERNLKSIFEIFKRIHKREKYSGTGIGLALCKKIVQKHQGTIWAESKVGEGSTFTFTLSKELK